MLPAQHPKAQVEYRSKPKTGAVLNRFADYFRAEAIEGDIPVKDVANEIEIKNYRKYINAMSQDKDGIFKGKGYQLRKGGKGRHSKGYLFVPITVDDTMR